MSNYDQRLQAILSMFNKKAYTPSSVLTPEAQAAAQAPPMDPNVTGAPMDPSMMPPMDPNVTGAPMDPSMMQGMPMDPGVTGAPMDPAMMPPMDPAMMQGMPADTMPMDPVAAPPAPGAQPVMLTLDDLTAFLQEVKNADSGKDSDSGRITNKELSERIDGIEQMLAAIMTTMNVPLPPPIDPEVAATDEASAEVPTDAVVPEMPVPDAGVPVEQAQLITPEVLPDMGGAPVPVEAPGEQQQQVPADVQQLMTMFGG